MNCTAPATTKRASRPLRRLTCLIAGLCSAMIAAPATAAIVTIDLASAGSPTSFNLTGLNAGKTFGDLKTTVSSFVTGGTLEVFYYSDLIGLDGDGNLRLAITGAEATPRKYTYGDSIDSSATFSTQDASTGFYYDDTQGLVANAANFAAGSFVGFRFGSGGNYNYGYIEVLWNWTGAPSTSTFQLLSAAYESTVNTAITPVAVAGVPEGAPLPGGLALLGFSGLILVSRRLRVRVPRK